MALVLFVLIAIWNIRTLLKTTDVIPFLACGHIMTEKVFNKIKISYNKDLFFAYLDDILVSCGKFSFFLWDLEGKNKRTEDIEWPKSEFKYDRQTIAVRFGATCPNGDMLICDLKNDFIFKRTPTGELSVFLCDRMHNMKRVRKKGIHILSFIF